MEHNTPAMIAVRWEDAPDEEAAPVGGRIEGRDVILPVMLPVLDPWFVFEVGTGVLLTIVALIESGRAVSMFYGQESDARHCHLDRY
jgi:hypothetical protein